MHLIIFGKVGGEEGTRSENRRVDYQDLRNEQVGEGF